MKIWFDTEFIEDGRTIELVSIGLVREDGATYYAESDQYRPAKASQWVKDNVLAHLKGGGAIKPLDVMGREIIEFAGDDPEFWAYYADYDWVALCQLYGTMMQLPDGWPMFCRDVKQLCVSVGDPLLPAQNTTEHHALNDALWTRQAWEFLQDRLPAHPAQGTALSAEQQDAIEAAYRGICVLQAMCRKAGLDGAVERSRDLLQELCTAFPEVYERILLGTLRA